MFQRYVPASWDVHFFYNSERVVRFLFALFTEAGDLLDSRLEGQLPYSQLQTDLAIPITGSILLGQQYRSILYQTNANLKYERKATMCFIAAQQAFTNLPAFSDFILTAISNAKPGQSYTSVLT